MRLKKSLTILVAIICLILFLSMYFMLNNIDEAANPDRNDDKLILLHFKDNILKLKDQLDANEKKIEELKELFAQATNQKLLLNLNLDSKISDVNNANRDVSGRISPPSLHCSASLNLNYVVNSKADIQMSEVFHKLSFDNPDGGVWKQGYPIQYKESQWNEDNKLLVFVIPHSHTDPGWLKTFEQYYYDQTSHILDLMVQKLLEYPKMRFVYAEMSFFSKWWQYASQNKRDNVKKLLDEKRLEIVTGGWVMSDEANSHYFALLDQMIEGNQWLNNELDYQPVSGWSIDPFGHSPTMAYLLKRMSFENMLIQRTHYSIKKDFSINRQLEFMWRQQWDDKGTTDMLCHMMPFYSYDVPHTCGPDPKICCQFDFHRMDSMKYSCPWKVNPVSIDESNVEERAQTLLDQYRKKSQLYNDRSNNNNNNVVLVPLGDDFRYDTSREWDQQYNNYQRLFDFMNQKKEWNVQAQFGTLSDYFTALRTRSGIGTGMSSIPSLNVPFPSLSGDFYVYADRDDHYWSGYFTSRPFYKKLDRELEHHQRLAEILYCLALSESRQLGSSVVEKSNMSSALVGARRNLGLFQHHDGITGTSKDHVVIDYGIKLLNSINSLKSVIIQSAEFLLSKNKDMFRFHGNLVFDLDETRGEHHDIPVANLIDLSLGSRTVYFYNSLGQSRKTIVTLHVTSAYIKVTDHEGQKVNGQVNPMWEDVKDDVLAISNQEFLLSFVVEIPALGFSSFQLEAVPQDHTDSIELASVQVFNGQRILTSDSPFKVEYITSDKEGTKPYIENKQLQLSISLETGLAQRIKWKETSKEEQMSISFIRYGTTHGKDKSGIYLFLPGGDAEDVVEKTPPLYVTKGWLYSEATTVLRYVVHSIRCSSLQGGLAGSGFDVLNVVDIRKDGNIELAMRIQTEVNNKDGTFYTDLNGFQVIKRKFFSKLPIQANFYPMPSVAYMEDADQRFTLLTAQSLGVASLKPGRLEVIQDRRLDQDDNRGVEQPLHDNKRTPNKFRIVFEKRQTTTPTSSPPHNNPQMGFLTSISQFLSLDLLYPIHNLPLSIFKDMSSSSYLPSLSPLAQSLPCDLHLVNMRSLSYGTVGYKSSGQGQESAEDVALIFHHVVLQCGYGVSEAVGCLYMHEDKIQPLIKDIFSKIPIKSIHATNLNLLPSSSSSSSSSLNQVADDNPFLLSDIPPNELKAYLLKLTNNQLKP